jgi:fused signal recognition particle receptor
MVELLQTLSQTELIGAIIVLVAFLLAGAIIYKKSKTPRLPVAQPTVGELKKPKVTEQVSKPGTKEIPKEVAKEIVREEPSAATLQRALAATRRGLFDRLKVVFGAQTNLEGEVKEQLEEILYTSDLGPATVEHLMQAIQEKLPGQLDFEAIRSALRAEISLIMEPVQHTSDAKGLDSLDDKLNEGPKPRIWMIVGVNGVGKTTTIGKLASLMTQKNLRVLVAAGDTFRAAASGQLKVWSERAQVEIFSAEGNAKPSGVAFDACQKAVNEKYDIVLLDTAGRLHTQLNLMEELKKIKRVIEKVVPGAPHQVLLVLDANSGQNALVQAKEFHEALSVNGVILTKLDGTAKGGVAVGLAHELHIPIKAVGIGEKASDLKPFSTREFVDSIL